MKTVIAYKWHTGRANIGIVVYRNNFGVVKAVMTTIAGVDPVADIQTIVDFGSKIPKPMAIGAFSDGMGTIEDIILWNDYKNKGDE